MNTKGINVNLGKGKSVLMSPIEKAFWDKAKGVIPNLIPQFEIGKYRVDFFVSNKGCVIELDGHEYHKSREQRTNDAKRERFIEMQGYQVVRFTGSEINRDINAVIKDVLQILSTPLLDSTKNDTQFVCYSFQREIERIALKSNMDIYSNDFYAKLHLGDDTYDPLSIEMLDNGETISISHVFNVNGDVGFDPKIEFHVIKINGKTMWFPYTYTNSMHGMYNILSKRTNDGIIVEDGVRLSDVVKYVETQWLRNIQLNNWFDDGIPFNCDILQGKLF